MHLLAVDLLDVFPHLVAGDFTAAVQVDRLECFQQPLVRSINFHACQRHGYRCASHGRVASGSGARARTRAQGHGAGQAATGGKGASTAILRTEKGCEMCRPLALDFFGRFGRRWPHVEVLVIANMPR